MPRRPTPQQAPAARQAARDAADRIYERRHACSDRVPDLDDLLAVAAFVYQHRAVPVDVMRRDIADAWQILDHLAHQIDLHRLRLLEAGQATPMSYGQLAEVIGAKSRAHVEAQLLLLRAAAAGEPKDLGAARRARRAQRDAARALERHRGVLAGCVHALVGARAQLPDEAQDLLDDLTGDPQASEASVEAQLRLIVRSAQRAAPGLVPAVARVAEALDLEQR